MGDWSILELVLFLMSAVYAVFSVILIDDVVCRDFRISDLRISDLEIDGLFEFYFKILVYLLYPSYIIGVFIRLMVSKYIEKKAKRIKRIDRLEELPHNNVLQPVEVRVDKEIDICSDRYYQATNEECVGINRGS